MRDLEIIKTQDCHYLLYMFFISVCKPLITNSNIFLYVSLIHLGAADQIIFAYSFHHEVAPRKVLIKACIYFSLIVVIQWKIVVKEYGSSALIFRLVSALPEIIYVIILRKNVHGQYIVFHFSL